MDYQLQQQSWSVRKGAIMLAYAADFARSLAFATQIYLVDAWAGAPSFGSGAWRVAGAPTILAQVAADVARQRHVRGLLLDDDPLIANTLAAMFADNPLVIVQHTTTHIATMMSQIEGAAALILLDGGVGMIPVSGGLDTLARRFAKTELLVRYDRQAIANLIMQRENEHERATIERQLDALFGQRTWRTIVENVGDADQRAAILRDVYIQTVLELQGTRFKWAAACPLTTRWGNYDYDLLFFTPDRNASTTMNAVLYAVAGFQREDPESVALWQQHGKPHQIGLFDATLPTHAELRQQTIDRLTTDVIKLCDAQPRLWSYGDMVDYLLRTGWFGQITDDHVQAACRHLEQIGRIKRIKPDAGWQPLTLLRLNRSAD